ncbi:MAG: hypothetical protein EAZ12_05865 [Sphingobacteriia bacterium]|nr:MAG: hypothetical protein EAZ12_05865 [Sphingobacteriia bacterium]
MKYLLLISFCFLVECSFCQSPISTNDSVELVWKTLKGAAFPATIQKKQLIYFTNDLITDTLELTIPKGKITETNISIAIKTASNKRIVSYTVPTKFFSGGAFNFASISNELPIDEILAIRKQRTLATSKSAIESSTKKTIDSIFNNITVSAADLAYLQSTNGFYSEYELLFKTLLNSKKRKALRQIIDHNISISVISNGERTYENYIAYSAKDKRVIQFAAVGVNYSFSESQVRKDPSIEIWRTLKGASFTETITKKQLVYFSDKNKKDTLMLTVPKGRIDKTIIQFAVKSALNKTVMQFSLHANDFGYGYFDQITGDGQLPPGVYEFHKQRILRDSKFSIQAFAINKIDSFFNKLIVDEIELESCLHFGNFDKDEEKLFMTLLNDNHPKAIKVFMEDEELPYIDWYYMAYSPQKKHGVRIAYRRD